MKEFIPVLTIKSINEVKDKITILKKYGVKYIEIAYRTKYASEAIKLANNLFPKLIIGAGTVINKKQCQLAIQAGSKFIVGPGFVDEVYKYCKLKKVPYYPGCLTPTEIANCINLGLTTLKIFPGAALGPNVINWLSEAFNQVKFLVTGGIFNHNAKEYLKLSAVWAIGGDWIFNNKFEKTTSQLMQIVNLH